MNSVYDWLLLSYSEYVFIYLGEFIIVPCFSTLLIIFCMYQFRASANRVRASDSQIYLPEGQVDIFHFVEHWTYIMSRSISPLQSLETPNQFISLVLSGIVFTNNRSSTVESSSLCHHTMTDELQPHTIVITIWSIDDAF